MSTKLEAAYKAQMVKDVITHGGYARRIEDQYTVGMPDCIFILPERDVCFAEVKRFTGNVFGPTPRQYVELMKIQKSSTKVAACVIGIKDDWYYIASPALQIHIRLGMFVCEKNFVHALEKYLR